MDININELANRVNRLRRHYYPDRLNKLNRLENLVLRSQSLLEILYETEKLEKARDNETIDEQEMFDWM